ncbi:MAG TPA: M28 family peptidase [Planctomycetota bacterium]|nr:M28 family peptidase [Planctomycetota bacterium]
MFAVALVGQAPVPEAAAPETPAPALDLKPPPGMELIAKKDLLAHATWLARDEMGGRLTGSPGQELAAGFIQAHFEKLGLEPLGDEQKNGRGYFQRYGINRTHVLPNTTLKLGSLTLPRGFAVLGGRPVDVSVKGKLSFCGLGRTRGKAADVATEASLEGQVAVVAIKPPRGRVDKPLSIEQKFGMSFASFGQLGRMAQALEKKGAVAVLFVQIEDPMGLSDVLNYLALAPGKDSLSPRFQGAGNDMEMLADLVATGGGAPALVLSVQASAQLLQEMAVDREALVVFCKGEGECPASKADVAAELTIAVARDVAATASNVVAVLRGSDPKLAAEAVVFSAHMDHVGLRIDGEVFNGADDNASGTAGLMAIATAFAKAGTKPRRSVIFLSVSGEELGLWGSAFFADHSTWDVANVVANVNTDMIGRSGPESGPDEILITPSYRHRMYSTIARDAAGFADALGVTCTSGDKYYERSDHYNFAKKGIPVVFFCNGEHEDYHQVSDTADKLDGAKMERMARLAYWTGWNVANADDRPRVLGRREKWR